MIKLDNVVTPSPEQFEIVIKGMRLPFKSGSNYDSIICDNQEQEKDECYKGCPYVDHWEGEDPIVYPVCKVNLDGDKELFVLGEKDKQLLLNLCKAGDPSHRKALRQLPVIMDITAPEYFWRQLDQYKVGTVTNSTSQMHTLLKRPFKVSDFSFEHIPGWKNVVEQKEPEFTEEELANEEWKDFNNGRQISNLGRYKPLTGKITLGSTNSSGYKKIGIQRKNLYIHRLVAEAFIPNPEDKKFVNHKNGNKLDNRVENLEWVTAQENKKHAQENHLVRKQLKCNKPKQRFSEEEMEEIRNLYKDGWKKKDIAKKFNCYDSTIHDIIVRTSPYEDTPNIFEDFAIPLINSLNELRDDYLEETDPQIKEIIWHQILELIPQSFNYTRCWSGNYETLVNIINQRKGHRLGEWHAFIDMLFEKVPYLKEIWEAIEDDVKTKKELAKENEELRKELEKANNNESRNEE